METMERAATTAPESGRKGGPLFVVVVAVVAMVFGGLAGWFIGTDDSTEDTAEVTEVITGELTERQQEMLRSVEELDAAMQAGTADAALVDRLFVPQGIYTIGAGLEYRVDDGTLSDFFERGSDRSASLYPPVLVADDVVVRLGDYGGSYSQTFKFTPTGEVLIIWSHTA